MEFFLGVTFLVRSL